MRAYRTHPTHKFQILCDSFVGCVPEGTHAVAWRLRLAESSAFSKASCKRGINRGKACANAAVPSCATSSNQSCSLIPKSATSWSGSGKDSGELLAIRIAALFRLLRVGFVRLPVRRLSAHRIPPPDNAQWKFFGYREPCPAENTAVRVRRYGARTGGASGYGAWFASKKLLKYGEFTGSDDVWGEGSGKICLVKWQKVV